jgi:ketosteroid isomerase-like protein
MLPRGDTRRGVEDEEDRVGTDEETRVKLMRWLDEFSDAVETRDLPGILELFGDSAEVSVWPSESHLVAGRDQVEAFFHSLCGKSFTISWTWEPRIVATVGDAGWIAADGEETYTIDDDQQRYPYRVTALFERRGDRWLCVHFHGSEPAHHGEETAFAHTRG